MQYDDAQLARLKMTVRVQLTYILYRFDRVVRMSRMSEDESLTNKFITLVARLGYTERYRALYRPVIDISTQTVPLPRDLVDLVVEYCRLDALALSPQDEELIIKRILA